jgi:hypothetical protein
MRWIPCELDGCGYKSHITTAREVCTGSWWGNLRESDRWGDPGVDGWIMLRWIFKKWGVGVRTGLDWLRIGIRGGRL